METFKPDEYLFRRGQFDLAWRLICGSVFLSASTVLLIVGSPNGLAWLGLFPFLGVIVSFLFVYWLEIDFQNCTWKRQTGLLGISKVNTGDFSDLESIGLSVLTGKYSSSFPVTVIWRGKGFKSFQVHSSTNLRESAVFARDLAKKLNVAVTQSKELAAYRRKNEVPQGILPPSE